MSLDSGNGTPGPNRIKAKNTTLYFKHYDWQNKFQKPIRLEKCFVNNKNISQKQPIRLL